VLPGRLRHRVGALSGASTALLAGDGPVVDPHHIQPVRGTNPRHLPHMAGARPTVTSAGPRARVELPAMPI
jgi:hypothetical protein